MAEKRVAIQKLANECVLSMGDIFWDAHEFGDARDARQPFDVAVEEVTKALCSLLKVHGIAVMNGPNSTISE